MKSPKNFQPKKRGQLRRQFHEEIKDKSARKLEGRREEKNNIWYGLGLFGIVGWAIAIPILVGIALGIWLDKLLASDFSWTLFLLLVGTILGCLNAWYWIQRESQDR